MYRLRTLAMAGALAVSGLSAPSVAWSAEPQWGPQNDFGYSEGYDRGSRAGAEDSRRGDRYQFADESDYRRGDLGYRSQFGNRERYRDSFRRGFEFGYRDGYGGGSYNRDGYRPGGYATSGYNSYAYERGMDDGYQAGLNDARGRRRYDPIGESRYRSGDHGYNNRYGSREAYRLTYRDAFKVGYERGYQDARRYNNRGGLGGFFGFLF